MKTIKTAFIALLTAGLLFVAIHYAWRDKHAYSSANGVWKSAHVTYKGFGLIGQSVLGYIPQKIKIDSDFGHWEATKEADGWHFLDFDATGLLLARGICPKTMTDDFGIPVPDVDVVSHAESFDLKGNQIGLITDGNGEMTKIFPNGAERFFVFQDGRQASTTLKKLPKKAESGPRD